MGIGKLGGPALGGILGSINLSLPFYITAGLIFLSALAAYFLLPESLLVEKRSSRISLDSFNTFSSIKEIFGFKEVGFLLLIGIIYYAGLDVFQFNFSVFLKDLYKWGPVIIGSVLTIVGICEIISRALLLP